MSLENLGAEQTVSTGVPEMQMPVQQAPTVQQTTVTVEGIDNVVNNRMESQNSRHWSTSLPEALQALTGDFASIEDAKTALERGKSYNPAIKIEDINITLPADVKINQGTQDNFKKFCVEHGITAKQAQDLASWQVECDRANIRDYLQASEKTLRSEWGNQFEPNRQKALMALTNLDRKMGGTLAPVLRDSLMHEHPAIIKALYHIGNMLGEDSVGSSTPTYNVKESPIDAFKAMFQ